MLRIHKNKLWYGFSLLTLIIVTSVSIVYSHVLIVYPERKDIMLALKITSLSTIFLTTLLYYSIYGFHTYAVFNGVGIFFCLWGDILLAISTQEIYFLLGGLFFCIARIAFISSLISNPYQYQKEASISISISWKRLFLQSCPNILYSISYGYYLYSKIEGLTGFLLLVYIIIIGLHNYTAINRIGNWEHERLFSTVVAMLGTILFCLSDSLLFYVMFIEYIQKIELISLYLYWLGIYLISLSLVRNSERMFLYKRLLN